MALRKIARAFTLLLLLLGVTTGSSARADTGGVPLDRSFGPRIDRLTRAASEPTGRGAAPLPPACSFHYPICIRGHEPVSTLRALAAAEDMWRLGLALDWPLPTKAIIELVSSLETNADVRVQLTHMEPIGAFDLAHTRVEVASNLTGCSLDHAVLRALVQDGAFSRSPGWKATLRDGWAAAMADSVLPCRGSDRVGRATWAQANPQIDVLGIGNEERTEATAAPEVFFRWLDAHYGKSILTAIAAMTAIHTPFPNDRWLNEPDVFDVLANNLKGLQFRDSSLFDVLTDFGMDRFFFGREPANFPEAARLPAVSPDWEIPWPETPRRLLGPRALSPFGSAYILINLEGRKGRGIRVEAEWEQFARIRWHFVKLDAGKHDLGRVPIPAADKATEAQMSLTELGDAAYLLLVGTSLGDPQEAFDPDWSSMEPHNYMVTLGSD